MTFVSSFLVVEINVVVGIVVVVNAGFNKLITAITIYVQFDSEYNYSLTAKQPSVSPTCGCTVPS